MYDVDPKWAELIKERGSIPHEIQKRLTSTDRKTKSSARSQASQDAASSSSTTTSQANLVTSMASTLSFPSLASAGLGNLPAPGLTPGLLSGLALGNFDPKNPLFDIKNNPLLDPKNNPFLDPKNHPLFDPKNLSLLDPKNSALFDPKGNPFFDSKNNPLLDPKNSALFDTKNNPLFDPKNPLLLPFGGLPNMSALSGMGPLSTSMNFFANLASMGLPSLSGLDPNASGTSTSLPSDQASPGSSSGKGKTRKSALDMERHSSSKTPPVSSSSSSSSTSIPNSVAGGLPFYFPNPSLLYSPLGLGGLNPFSLPPAALSSAYDNLAQQCGLLNGGLGGASTSGTQSSRGNSSHRSQNATGNSKAGVSSSGSSSSSHRHHRSGRDSIDRHNLQHLLMPHDAHFLESLGRVSSVEAALRNSEKRSKEGSDRKEGSERSEKRSRDGETVGKSSAADFSTSSRTEDRQSRRVNRADHDKKDSISTQNLLVSSLSEMDERMLRRLKEPDMKEALEVLSRSHAELFAKSMAENALKMGDARDISSINMSDLISRTIEEHSAKTRSKETSAKEALAAAGTSITEVKGGSDIILKKFSSSLFSDVPESGGKLGDLSSETITKKKTREKGACCKQANEVCRKHEPTPEESLKEKDLELRNSLKAPELEPAGVETTEEAAASGGHKSSKVVADVCTRSSFDSSEKSDELVDGDSEAQSEAASSEAGEAAKGPGRGRRGRQMKKTRTKSDPEEQPVVERKNLRSSAGRAARAAAERAALRETGKGSCEKSESEDEQKQNETRDDS